MPNTTLYRASQNHNGCQLVSCFTLPHGRHARRLVKTPTSRGGSWQIFKMKKNVVRILVKFHFSEMIVYVNKWYRQNLENLDSRSLFRFRN